MAGWLVAVDEDILKNVAGAMSVGDAGADPVGYVLTVGIAMQGRRVKVGRRWRGVVGIVSHCNGRVDMVMALAVAARDADRVDNSVTDFAAIEMGGGGRDDEDLVGEGLVVIVFVVAKRGGQSAAATTP
jgi:hypothetical protein